LSSLTSGTASVDFCPMLKTNGPHKTAAMQQMTYVPEGEIKLACGCMMSVIVAGALSPGGQVKLAEGMAITDDAML